MDIVRYDEMRRALTELSDIHDITQYRDQALAVKVYYQAQMAFEDAMRASELCLRAERAAGVWLAQNIQHGGSKDSREVTLADVEITPSQSSRWQKLATMEDEDFEAYFEECYMSGWMPSYAGILRFGRSSTERSIDIDAWINRARQACHVIASSHEERWMYARSIAKKFLKDSESIRR